MHVHEGLLPEWLIYHELAETGRVALRKVCAVERAWLEPTLQRLQSMDAQRLAKSGADHATAGASAGAGAEAAHGVSKAARVAGAEASTIGAAKARALARRAANSAAKKR